MQYSCYFTKKGVLEHVNNFNRSYIICSLPKMGNEVTEKVVNHFRNQKIITCPNCMEAYNLDVRLPKMICTNQHNICDKCLQQLRPKVCPECKQKILVNKKRNVLLCHVLELMQGDQIDKNRLQNSSLMSLQKNGQGGVDDFENRGLNTLDFSSKKSIKLKMVKQQSIPNINLEQYNEQRQFKKKYSVANIFTATRMALQADSKPKIKQETFEDVLLKNAEDYNISAFKEIVESKKNIHSVVNLDLHLCKIAKIFQFIPKFVSLVRLNLNKNRIEKMENLNELKSLTYLSLSDNQIEQIEGIGELTSLKNLYLNKNRIQKIMNLQNLKSLQFLGLGSNLIERIQNLNSLVEIKWLNLEFNYITKIEGIAAMKNLQIILLGSNQITVFEGFEMFPNLKEIHIQSNKINDLSRALSMKHLRKLKLEDNPGLKQDNSKEYVKLLQIIEAKSKGIEKGEEGCLIY